MKTSMPLADFACTSCLPQSTADAWTYAQKDAALMQTAVVDDNRATRRLKYRRGLSDDTVYAIEHYAWVTFDNRAER